MKNCLPRDHRTGGEADVVIAGVEIAQVVRVVAARNLNPNSVTAGESVSGRSPEIDRVFVRLIRSDRTQVVGVEFTVVMRITMSGPRDSFGQE